MKITLLLAALVLQSVAFAGELPAAPASDSCLDALGAQVVASSNDQWVGGSDFFVLEASYEGTDGAKILVKNTTGAYLDTRVKFARSKDGSCKVTETVGTSYYSE